MSNDRAEIRKSNRNSRRRKRNRINLRFIALIVILIIIIVGVILIVKTLSAPKDSEGDVNKGTNTEDVGGASDTAPADAKPADAEPADPDSGDISNLYYYEAERADRYTKYAEANPSIPMEDIVWMVNVDLDYPAYENTNPVPDPDSTTLLVNKHFYLPDDYWPSNMGKVNTAEMKAEVAEALRAMIADGEKEGMSIVGQSGFRDYNTQKYIYDGYVNRDGVEKADTYSARAGYSEHQTGLTVDLNNAGKAHVDEFAGTKEAAWVRENGHKYGFIVRYTIENESVSLYMPEDWHMRYIGVEHATKMHAEGIQSYEEYYIKFVKNVPR